MSTSHAFATVEALRIVLREEQPPAMAEVLRDMERARMTAEDCRGAMDSWKEFGKARDRRCNYVTFSDFIEPAFEALDQMRRDMYTKLIAPGSFQPIYRALETAHSDICRSQSILRELEDEEDQTESAESANTESVVSAD